MEDSEDVRFKQCAIIEHLTVEKIPPIDIHFCRQFKQGVEEVSLCNPARSGRPATATDKSHQECTEEIEKMVKSNRKTLLSNWESLKSGPHYQHFGFQRGCAKWSTQKLTDEKKTARVGVSRELLGRSEEQGEGFLRRIVKGDETWVHHFDPKNIWSTTTKDYQYQRNSKPKPLLEKSC